MVYSAQQIVALGVLCMPTNERSKGEDCWLQNSRLIKQFPNHHYTHLRSLKAGKLCLPLYSFAHLCFSSFIDVLGHCLKTLGPQVQSNILEHNCILFRNDVIPQPLIQFCYDSQAKWPANMLLLLNEAEARLEWALPNGICHKYPWIVG